MTRPLETLPRVPFGIKKKKWGEYPQISCTEGGGSGVGGGGWVGVSRAQTAKMTVNAADVMRLSGSSVSARWKRFCCVTRRPTAPPPLAASTRGNRPSTYYIRCLFKRLRQEYTYTSGFKAGTQSGLSKHQIKHIINTQNVLLLNVRIVVNASVLT